MSVASAVRAALHDADAQLAVDRVQSPAHLEQESMATPRVTTILLGLFGGLAMLISACGIAAVMALSVTQRTSELGIRMALGASRDAVLFLVTRQGLAIALAGTVLGAGAAIVVTRLLRSLLYDTSPTDVMTFGVVSALFITVAAVASYVLARGVTEIDPAVALRQD